MRWKKMHHDNAKQKKAGVTILLSDKVDFRAKKITRDKEGHYMGWKGQLTKKT